MRHTCFLRLLYVFFVVLGCAQMQGCVPARPSAAPVVPVEVLQSETLRLEKNPSIETSVYVSLRDASNKVFGLRKLMEDRLRSLGYSVTENPSRAGYILQLHVVRAGQMDPAAVRAAVAAGHDAEMSHGAEAALGGDGACALVADILVALRRTPKTSRGQSHVIKNASVRTTVGRHQLRVAALDPDRRCTFATALPQLEEGVVDAVAAVLPPSAR